jgi:hypothetical protein
MKTNMLLLAALFLMGTGFAACNNSNDDGQEGTDVPFAEYSLESGIPGEAISACWVNLEYDEIGGYNESKTLVIDSDEELKKHVEGDYPTVDFSKKTLVLAYGCHSGTAFGYDGLKFQQVSDRNYVMTANGRATAATAFFEWRVAIVVDKLPSDSKIKLNVTNNMIE